MTYLEQNTIAEFPWVPIAIPTSGGLSRGISHRADESTKQQAAVDERRSLEVVQEPYSYEYWNWMIGARVSQSEAECSQLQNI